MKLPLCHLVLPWAILGWAQIARAAEPTTAAKTKPAVETGPALGWTFPLFSDAEGYHLYTLRGDTARMISADEIDVTGFNAVIFSGDATERVDSVLLSPQATFNPKENRVTGNSSVRLIRDDVEVTGRGWTYEHNLKKVSISHDVRVTFHSQLNDILK
jgi:lipopolysaccharide export system protein LptC